MSSAYAKDPKYKEAIVTLANMKIDLQDYQGAKHLYRQAFDLNYQSADLFHNYGAALQHLGTYTSCI